MMSRFEVAHTGGQDYEYDEDIHYDDFTVDVGHSEATSSCALLCLLRVPTTPTETLRAASSQIHVETSPTRGRHDSRIR